MIEPGKRVDQFIRAVGEYGLKAEAARIFAMDALIDYAAEQVSAALRERDQQWRKAVHEGMEKIGSSAIMYAPALYQLLKEEP